MTATVYDRPWSYAPPHTDYAPGGADLIYADDDILIVHKPSGLLTVPGKADGLSDCLEARVQAQFKFARIVHRLDMDTSGLMILARHHKAQRHLGRQFEKRRTEKLYIADVAGVVKDAEGTVDAPLRCDWDRRPLQMIDPELGKPAVTDWHVLARAPGKTRLALRPITGRSHQLRVHLLSMGHPILGDRLYAPDPAFSAAPRLLLHAQALTLYHPADGTLLTFEHPCPF